MKHDPATCPLCSSGAVFILIDVQVWSQSRQKFVTQKVHPNHPNYGYSLN